MTEHISPTSSILLSESFDFGSLEQMKAHHRQQFNNQDKTNNNNNQDTLSTFGESGSSYDFSLPLPADYDDDSEGDYYDDLDDSLTLDDIVSFCKEDHVGAFYDVHEEVYREPPPAAPKPEDFKGDSQNSFTLDDLESMTEEEEECKCQETSLLLEKSITGRQRPMQLDLSQVPEEGTEQDLDRSPVIQLTGNHDQRVSLLGFSLGGDLDLSQFPGGDDDDLLDYDDEVIETTVFVTKKDAPAKKLKGILKHDKEDEEKEPSSLSDIPMFSRGRSSSNNKHASTSGNGWMMMMQSFHLNDDSDPLLQIEHVSFGTVQVYEHAYVAGDTPVKEGAPLSFAWKAERTQTFSSVDEYETAASTSRTTTSKATRLDPEQRMFRLVQTGVPFKTIQQAEARAAAAYREREETKHQCLLGSLELDLFVQALQLQDEDEQDDAMLFLPKNILPRRKTTPRNSHKKLCLLID